MIIVFKENIFLAKGEIESWRSLIAKLYIFLPSFIIYEISITFFMYYLRHL
jgi:hypothetical protein